MENTENQCFVEVVTGGIQYRNNVVSNSEYQKLVLENSWKNEMYRSYFVFNETFDKHVQDTGTVKNYSGPCAIDYIILDVDKGEIPKDQMLGYIEACLSEMFDKGVMEEDINLWFSGTGFHIEMKNVFGLQQSSTVHDKLRLTMNKHFDFADSIYDKTRIIRTKWSLNPKTHLHKIWIPLAQLGELSWSKLEKYASSKENYLDWVNEDSDNFFETLFKEPKVEPYLQSMVIASQTIATKNDLTKNSSEVSSVVSCMQHIFNEGPHIGARNNKMMRMASTYKRAGIPFIVALNGMLTWSGGEMSEDEVTRTVTNVYEGNYQYGCDDHIMAEYCDSKCIYYKRKDYKLDIKNINELELSLRDYLTNTLTQNSIKLDKIYGCQPYNFAPGELVVFSGDTGLGKTAFIQDIIVKAKQHTLFLSLEMNEQLIFRRFAQIAVGKDKQWIMDQYSNNPDFTLEDKLDHVQVMTIAPRIDAIKKVVAEYQPKVLVVDTTDEIQVDFVKGEIEKQNVVIGALKQIAQKTNIIIVAIHHLNKTSASNNVINLHSLKGSSNVVQKADKVILIKGNRDDSLRVVQSVKSRDEGSFEMSATFDTNTMQFNLIGRNNETETFHNNEVY